MSSNTLTLISGLVLLVVIALVAWTVRRRAMRDDRPAGSDGGS